MPFFACQSLRKFRPNPKFNMGFGTSLTLFKSDIQWNGRKILFRRKLFRAASQKVKIEQRLGKLLIEYIFKSIRTAKKKTQKKN